jgi:hypothetical protein
MSEDPRVFTALDTMKPHWRTDSRSEANPRCLERYVRCDGAVVMWDDSSPDPNPLDPNSRMYTAWEPDPGTSYLKKQTPHTVFGIPRRWKTAQAAMNAVDREYPSRDW